MFEELRQNLCTLPASTRMLASFLPIVAIVVTAGLGAALRGRARVWTLVLAPAAFAFLCWLLGPAVGRDGNMLGALLYALYFLGLVIYYPTLVLVLAGVTALGRRHKARGA